MREQFGRKRSIRALRGSRISDTSGGSSCVVSVASRVIAKWDIRPKFASLLMPVAMRQTFDGGDIIRFRCMPYSSDFDWKRSVALVLAISIIGTLTLIASGCAPAALSSAHRKMVAGQYAEAHQELAAIPLGTLSDSQRREVKDDLCLSEFMIGEPTYSPGEQRRVCVDATTEIGSRSAELVERIDAQVRRASSEKVNAALAKGDLGGAEQAAQVYLGTPGADPAVVAKWSHQMWELVNRRDSRPETHRKKQLDAAIAAVRKQYPSMRKMTKTEFMVWVAQQGSVAGTAMFSSVALKDKELDLAIRRQAVQTASLKLDRISAINDATIARCGCDGRTNVGIAETNFPLYLVRLDPETQRSEVIILPHRQ